MEFKGTKGKWELDINYDRAYSQQVLNISNEIDGCMATVWTGKDIDEEIYEETRYNALLISKAPEMLKFMQSMVSDYENGLIDDIEDLITKAEKLIKEATEL